MHHVAKRRFGHPNAQHLLAKIPAGAPFDDPIEPAQDLTIWPSVRELVTKPPTIWGHPSSSLSNNSLTVVTTVPTAPAPHQLRKWLTSRKPKRRTREPSVAPRPRLRSCGTPIATASG